MYKHTFSVLLIALMSCGLLVQAQEKPQPPGSKQGPPAARADRKSGPKPGAAMGSKAGQWPGKQQAGKNKDIRELMKTIKMIRMSRELGLDEKQTVIMIRRFDKMDAKKEKLRKEHRKLAAQLRASLDKAEDGVVTETLDKLVAHDKRMAQMHMDSLEKAGEGLAPEQKAKLYLFLRDFDRDIRGMIRQAKLGLDGESRGGQGRGRGGMQHGPGGPIMGPEGRRAPGGRRRPGWQGMQQGMGKGEGGWKRGGHGTQGQKPPPPRPRGGTPDRPEPPPESDPKPTQ